MVWAEVVCGCGWSVLDGFWMELDGAGWGVECRWVLGVGRWVLGVAECDVGCQVLSVCVELSAVGCSAEGREYSVH